MSEYKPIMRWDSGESFASGLVWWTRLDGRYQIEVQRKGADPVMGPEGPMVSDDAYGGMLCIFDHGDGDRLLHSEPVSLSYGAPFGPDVADVEEWQDRAMDFVDNKLGRD